MSIDTFLCEIDVTGSITKRISAAGNDSRATSVFYSAQVISTPNFSLSGDGWISAGFGSLVINNNPRDEDAVFCYADGTYPPELKDYTVRFQYGENAEFLFNGTAVIRSISDKGIELDIVEPAYSEDLLVKTLDTESTRAESTSNASGLIRVSSPIHGLSNGNVVTFEDMNVTTEINYDGTSATEYTVNVIDANTFDLLNTDATLVTLGANSVGQAGIPQLRRMAFGVVTQKVPIKKSSTVISNPHLNITKIIKVYEDGVLIGVGRSTSTSRSVTSCTPGTTTEYFVSNSTDFLVGEEVDVIGFTPGDYNVANQTITEVTSTSIKTDLNSSGFAAISVLGTLDFSDALLTTPTNDKITLNGAAQGEVSVSGEGVNATTLASLCTYIVSTVSGINSVDTTTKSDNGSTAISFFIESQIKVIDLLNQVLPSFNHQFYIDVDQIVLIDRAKEVSSTSLDNFIDIEEIEPIKSEFPNKTISSTITRRVPFTSTSNTLGTETETSFANSTKYSVGSEKTITAYVEDNDQMRGLLVFILAIDEKPVYNIRQPFININIKPGDVLTFNDQEKELTCKMTVREISYDFIKEKTDISGDGTFSILER